MARRRSKKEISKQKNKEIILYIISLVLIALIFVSIFKFGSAGLFLDNLLKNIFGDIPYYFFMFLLLGNCGYILVKARVLKLTSRYVVGSLFFMIGLIILSAAFTTEQTGLEIINIKDLSNSELGLLQMVLYGVFSNFFSLYGSIIFGVIFLIIGLIIYFMISISTYLQKTGKHIRLKNEELKQKILDNEKNKPTKTNRKKLLDYFKDDKLETSENINEQEVFTFSPEEIFEESNKNIDFEKTDSIIKENEIELPFDDILIEQKKEQEIIIKKNIKSEAKDYKLPSFDLLNNPKTSDALIINQKNAQEKALQLKQFLSDGFGLEIEISNINIGPSITKLEVTLSPGIKVSKITSLERDIKLALAVKEIRIEAPIPGKSAIGIEIPNAKNNLITLKEVLKDIDFEKENKLVVGLGKDINGRSIYTSLNKMPHLLVAGATGSGKSVCINGIITSILMNAHYNEVKLLLIDPKKVELSIYNGLPHLIAPVINDPKAASIALKRVVDEMDYRYQLFAEHKSRNIEVYNEFVSKFNKKVVDDNLKLEPLPYIVVVIDELADLMMISPKEVDDCIMRITQMARAAGIHLIVATQRPSTDIITGTIKANIPSRIAFAVSSNIDSRTILNSSGAEKLLGKGDMLFSKQGSSAPIRLQGAYLSDKEIENVVYAIKKQNIFIDTNKNFDDLDEDSKLVETFEIEDEKYYEVEDFVKKQETISASQIQRYFKVGYNRAANLIDELERNKIIDGPNGSKPRNVLIRNEELE